MSLSFRSYRGFPCVMRCDEQLWYMRQTTAFDRGCVKTWAASVRDSEFLSTSHTSVTEWTVAMHSGVGCHCDAARYVVFSTT